MKYEGAQRAAMGVHHHEFTFHFKSCRSIFNFL